jgi:glycerol-3-phosphate acyltransferase PlsY
VNLGQSDIEPEMIQLTNDLWLGIIGLSVVSGHMFSVFLSFKGGKGVATGFGFLLVYSPLVAGIMLLVWILAAAVSRYSSLGAISAVSAMPFLFLLFKASTVKISIAVLLAVLILYKHKSNIRSLIAGEESKIGNKDGEEVSSKE